MSISINSIFVSFEGIDGCGKSTQVKLLMEKLYDRKIKAFLVREPGGSKIAEHIRSILLDTYSKEYHDLTMMLNKKVLTDIKEKIINDTKN